MYITLLFGDLHIIGPVITIEINESLLSKRKYSRGQILPPKIGVWRRLPRNKRRFHGSSCFRAQHKLFFQLFNKEFGWKAFYFRLVEILYVIV